MWKTQSNIVLNNTRLNVSPLGSGVRQGGPLLPLLLNIVLKVTARAMRQDKEISSIQTAKEEVKFPHCTDIMILYIRP